MITRLVIGDRSASFNNLGGTSMILFSFFLLITIIYFIMVISQLSTLVLYVSDPPYYACISCLGFWNWQRFLLPYRCAVSGTKKTNVELYI